MRHYPHGELAAHVLGSLGEINEKRWKEARAHGYRLGDVTGQAGIEQRYERALCGAKGAGPSRSYPDDHESRSSACDHARVTMED